MKAPAIQRPVVLVVLICAILSFALRAVAASDESGRGFTLYGGFQGSANSAGLVTKLDTSLGCDFNRYFGIEIGIPFYFVRPSATTTSTTGTSFTSGIGNVYSDWRYSLPNPAINFGSVLTFTVPTGDTDKGLSTGRMTVDWTNHFDRRILLISPFVNLGLANTVSDTPFFLRPFSSRGFVSHFEGGTEIGPLSSISLGASAYAIAPSGGQTIISRVIPNEAVSMPAIQPGGGNGNGHGMGALRSNANRPFETISENAGGPELARDHGFSLWFVSRPSPYMAFEVGYSRSIRYAFNTYFFGTSFNIGAVASEWRNK